MERCVASEKTLSVSRDLRCGSWRWAGRPSPLGVAEELVEKHSQVHVAGPAPAWLSARETTLPALIRENRKASSGGSRVLAAQISVREQLVVRPTDVG
jgi:hypothetical protein